jgi:hypothetical protein
VRTQVELSCVLIEQGRSILIRVAFFFFEIKSDKAQNGDGQAISGGYALQRVNQSARLNISPLDLTGMRL